MLDSGHYIWGCFGGALDAGEEPLQALRRELREEIELQVRDAQLVARFDFDFSPAGLGKAFRAYYLIDVSANILSKLVLHEGQRMEALSYEQLISGIQVVPYDAFATHLVHAGLTQGGIIRAS